MQPVLPPPGNTPGERIRWARLSLNLTIVQTAKMTGLTPQALSHIENDHTPGVRIATIRLLSVALKQPISFLGCFEMLPETSMGQRIQKARLYCGLNRKEFARSIGVNEKTVRLWEDDICQPSKKSLLVIKKIKH